MGRNAQRRRFQHAQAHQQRTIPSVSPEALELARKMAKDLDWHNLTELQREEIRQVYFEPWMERLSA